MQIKKIIPEYNSSNLPVSRKEVAAFLISVEQNLSKLSHTDKKFLKDYEAEFEYDMYQTANSQNSLLKRPVFKNIFEDNMQKHLYFYTDSNKTFFGDLGGGVSQRGSTGDSLGKNSILLANLGIQLRGTINNSVAYFIKVLNGRFANASDSDIIFASLTDPVLNGNSNFVNSKRNFNSFEGYLRYQIKSNWLSLTFGRTPLYEGFGYIDKLFLSNNTVPFDFGKLDIKYKAVEYSFAYGSLKGDSIGIFPVFTNRELSSKNIATHNLNINFSGAFKLGFWESVIISEQPFSFTYLNPVSFLTSADLSVGKEQTTENNSLLGIDAEFIPVKNFSIQSSLLIDDLTFGTLGKKDSLNENKFGWQFGALWSHSPDMDISIEFTHLDPFVYSHRSNKSTFTNHSMSLGHALPPNSDEIAFLLNYNITNRLKIKFQFQHQRSGEGILLDSAGKLIANYGGNINFGLGDAYLRSNGFLDGTRINRDIISANFIWQPVKQFYLEGKYQYRIIKNLSDNLNFKDSHYFATFRVDL